MRRILFTVLPLTLAFLLAACAAPAQDASIISPSNAAVDGPQKITAEEAKQKMEEDGVTIVDVRTAEEYAEAHIPDAILLPNETLDQEAASALPDQEAVLLVYCRTGVRSKEASEKLVKLGYQNVYDFGGIQDWPYDTVGE